MPVWAYGVQYHMSNFYTHGCPSDPGCTSGSGDNNRVGFIIDESAPLDAYLFVQVFSAETGAGYTYAQCTGCGRVDAEYDTNPKLECDFKTWHVAVVNGQTVLNGHYHWTLAATSASGC